MANENTASYARIGLVVMLGIAATVFTLIYFGGWRDTRSECLVETYYDHPVSGLSVGSVVNFRGVKVGEVRSISFVLNDYDDTSDEDRQRIRIVMAIGFKRLGVRSQNELEALVRRFVTGGLRATLISNGITGMSRVELNYVPNVTPPPPLSWKPEHILIPPSPSLFESVTDGATRLMKRLEKVDFAATWSNVASVAQSSAEITANANDFFQRERAGLSAIIRNCEETTASMRELADSLKANPSLLVRPNDPIPLPETR